MTISHYLKDIGRGKHGAKPINRNQAADLMGQVLDGAISDLELGAFCLAMRIKGETEEEMAGFLDATYNRLNPIATGGAPTVVLPSYNGARKLPVLTPLLAMLLAREGVAVVLHGTATEEKRVSSEAVWNALGQTICKDELKVHAGQVLFVRTATLHAGLDRLLSVRRQIGLRNSAHSLVKLMNPCDHTALVIGSYTHPEYLHSMSATFALMDQHAMLLRGTEGEPVADARRTPNMDVFKNGLMRRVQEQHDGSLVYLPDMPAIDASSTATYINQVLRGQRPVPEPIALQVRHILEEVKS